MRRNNHGYKQQLYSPSQRRVMTINHNYLSSISITTTILMTARVVRMR